MITKLIKISRASKETNDFKDEKFIFFLTFLYSIASGNVSEIEIFKSAKDSVYGLSSSIFKEVFHLGVGWSFGLSHSCKLLADRIPKNTHQEIHKLLVKLSQILQVGEKLKSFMESEWKNTLENYSIIYEKNLETQKIFLEMYYTLMSTSAFLISAAAIMSMLMGSGNPEQLILLAILGVTGGLGMLLFMMYKTFPRDYLAFGNTGARKFRLIVYGAIVLGVTMGSILLITNTLDTILIIAVVFAPLLYPGYIAKKKEENIRSLNEWYPEFITHFGKIYSILGSMSNTLETVTKSEFGSLQKILVHFRNRIQNRIEKDFAFEIFSEETSSYLIHNSNFIISKSLDKGGNMEVVGDKVAHLLRIINGLRGKRIQNSKTFEITVVMLHVLSLAVFGLMVKLTTMFHLMISTNSSGNSPFALTPLDPQFLSIIIAGMIVINSIMTGFAIKIAQGGVYKTVLYNIALLGIIGSIATYAVTLLLNNLIQDAVSEVNPI